MKRFVMKKFFRSIMMVFVGMMCINFAHAANNVVTLTYKVPTNIKFVRGIDENNGKSSLSYFYKMPNLHSKKLVSGYSTMRGSYCEWSRNIKESFWKFDFLDIKACNETTGRFIKTSHKGFVGYVESSKTMPVYPQPLSLEDFNDETHQVIKTGKLKDFVVVGFEPVEGPDYEFCIGCIHGDVAVFFKFLDVYYEEGTSGYTLKDGYKDAYISFGDDCKYGDDEIFDFNKLSDKDWAYLLSDEDPLENFYLVIKTNGELHEVFVNMSLIPYKPEVKTISF